MILGVAFRAQLGTATYGITKMAFQRLHDQLVHELAPMGIGVAMVMPGVVDTEGLWEHYELAKAQQLPHVEYFDTVKLNGQIISSEECAQFFSYVLCETTQEDYSKEWRVNDESLWHVWKEN